ncbi:hypothetical protein ACFLU3_04000 [Chloroflexota bacterium]
MADDNLLNQAQLAIETGFATCHCNQCGCMIEALKSIKKSLDHVNPNNYPEFRKTVELYLGELKSAEKT